MKARNKYLALLGIVILVLVVGFFAFTYSQTFFTQELGWIPLTEATTGITNYVPGNAITDFVFSSGGTFQHRIADSKYWSIYYYYNRYAAEAPLPTGDDNDITIMTGNTNGIWMGVSPTITLKKNLMGINFQMNYEISPDRDPSASGCGSVNNYILGKPYVDQYGNFQQLAELADGKGIIELKADVLNPKHSKLYVNGLFVNDIYGDSFNLSIHTDVGCKQGYSGYAWVRLYNPRYKPLFDCVVDNDEVLIFDEFVSSVSFDINDLTYPVQKFCINQPPIIRSFSDRGIATDTDGQILVKLSEGGTVTVPSDQTIRVPYITKVQTGILRCPTSEAYNTKTQLCENILSEGLPDEKGTYITVLDIGENQFSSQQMYNSLAPITIGDYSFNPSEQKYDIDKCGCTIPGRISINEVDKSCWYIEANGNKITSDTTYKPNNYIDIYYLASGAGVFNGNKVRNTITTNYKCTYTDEDDWINLYRVTINKEGLKIINSSTNLNPQLNSINNLKVTVDNKLGNFGSSGFKVRVTESLLDRVTDKDIITSFTKGVREYTIPLEQSTLGNIDVEVIPFVDIEGKRIYGTSKAVYKYVVTEYITNTIIQNNTIIQYVNHTINNTQFEYVDKIIYVNNTIINYQCTDNSIVDNISKCKPFYKNYIFIGIIIFIILGIVGLLYYKLKK